MKLKQVPADFVVEELPGIEISLDTDEHMVFLLEKQGIDTFDAIRLLARKFRLSLFEIGYAGLKDKHALARQYVSIPTQYHVQDIRMESLSLRCVGYSRKKIKIGDLNGNRFVITVRDVMENQLPEVCRRAETVPSCGVPNYFDSQRFGSVIDGTFIGKLVVQKQYEAAVKQYLTAYQKSESKKIKDEKRKILAHWNALSSVRVYNKAFAAVIKEYLKTQSWLVAYKRIPAHLREMFVNAYQSYVWNECVKEVMKTVVERKKLYSVEYAIGSLLFYTDLSEQELQRIPPAFQTVSDTARFSSEEQQVVNQVLSKQGITQADLAIEAETGNFFKTRARPIIIVPENFTIADPTNDELNNKENTKRYKIQVNFTLPKGSYATIVTKRLFNH